MPAAISGNVEYSVNGTGTLAFYGRAREQSGRQRQLGSTIRQPSRATSRSRSRPTVSRSNGQALPAGTYTITTSSATLTGSGATSSPNFAGSVSITATGGTINLGPGTGSLAVGGKPLDPDDETTLDGYTGDLLRLGQWRRHRFGQLERQRGQCAPGHGHSHRPSPPTRTRPSPSSPTFRPASPIPTPSRRTPRRAGRVTIDASGNVTATPAPGLQSGTYPIQIIAQSQTDANLEAQTTVEVTITPTQPGITLSRRPRPALHRSLRRGAGPHGLPRHDPEPRPGRRHLQPHRSRTSPAGFTLVQSGTQRHGPGRPDGNRRHLPASRTPARRPCAGHPALVHSHRDQHDRSVDHRDADRDLHRSRRSMPSPSPRSPAAVSTTPGSSGHRHAHDHERRQRDGEQHRPDRHAPLGPDAHRPRHIPSLAIGQSTTETITLTPDASTPLNSMLDSDHHRHVRPRHRAGDPDRPASPERRRPRRRRDRQRRRRGRASSATPTSPTAQRPQHRADQPRPEPDQRGLPGPGPGQPHGRRRPARGRSLPRRARPHAHRRWHHAGAGHHRRRRPGRRDAPWATTSAPWAPRSPTRPRTASRWLRWRRTARSPSPRSPPPSRSSCRTSAARRRPTTSASPACPPGVTGTLSQSSVTLDPGQAIRIERRALLTVTLTSTSTTALAPFSFTVTATAEGPPRSPSRSPARSRRAVRRAGHRRSRPTRPFTNPGGQVDVSAQILNAVNQQQQAMVSYTVTDSSGNGSSRPRRSTTTLNVLSTLSTVDLGNLDTTGFALGDDTITVTVDRLLAATRSRAPPAPARS